MEQKDWGRFQNAIAWMLRWSQGIAGVAILFVVIAYSSALAQQPQPQYRPPNRAFNAPQVQSPAAAPINPLTPEQISKAITDGVNAAVEQYEARHPAAPGSRYFNLLLLIFAGGLLLVGIGQCLLLFRAQRATANAAKAAQDCAAIAEKALTDIERPFPSINVIDVSILPSGLGVHHPTATFQVINVGKQPAIIDIATVEIRLMEGRRYPTPGDFDAQQQCVVIFGPKTIPAYGVSCECKRNEPITREEVDRIQAKTMQVYFFGLIKYRDPFGIARESGFCMRFVPPAAGGGPMGRFETVADPQVNYDKKVDWRAPSELSADPAAAKAVSKTEIVESQSAA
jgi:hypothetical protein